MSKSNCDRTSRMQRSMSECRLEVGTLVSSTDERNIACSLSQPASSRPTVTLCKMVTAWTMASAAYRPVSSDL